MSKKKLIGIIGVCVVVVIVVIVIITHPPTPSPTDKYTLSVSVSPSGAGSISPSGGEYESGVQVTLAAVPTDGYQFVNWSGDVATIGNANAAQTTFTMPAQDVIITANFFQGQLIQNWYDLDDIRNNLGDNYLLMNDLDSTTTGYEELASPTANEGKGWQPIGNADDEFTGTFDGQGYELRDLFIDRPNEEAVGLFSVVHKGGTIKNIGVVNADLTGDGPVGSLTGGNYGIVTNSYSTGSVTGAVVVGGLVGYCGGDVSNSYSTASVSGNNFVGGMLGYFCYGTVSNSHSTGSLTGNNFVGGLLGYNFEGTASNSYSTGSVTGNEYVAGLVAANEGTVSYSYSIGSVTGNSYVGGLVGRNFDGTVNDSFWDTQTSGQATSEGGTGKTTAQMKDIATFTASAWDIIGVADAASRNTDYTWNIVDGQTYPVLSWQPIS